MTHDWDLLSRQTNWPLFHKQKLTLVTLASYPAQKPEVTLHLDGIISLLDSLQDSLEPETPETPETSETPEIPEEVTKP